MESGIVIERQLQDLFAHVGFTIREPLVLQAIQPELHESGEVHSISGLECNYAKTLGLEWNTTTDLIHLVISIPPSSKIVMKRILLSDIAKVFDILGSFTPKIICLKILLQRVWEEQLVWDDSVPARIQQVWCHWSSELQFLSSKSVPRYFPKSIQETSLQLHGFSDASEGVYAGVVYFRLVDTTSAVQTSLLTAKSNVPRIKRISIPRMELCGAVVLSRILHHITEVFQVPLLVVHAWTDSTIVLNWLVGNPQSFKTYVGNRIFEIVDQIPPDRWNHTASADDPADCASLGLCASRLFQHQHWWSGPPWLGLESAQ